MKRRLFTKKFAGLTLAASLVVSVMPSAVIAAAHEPLKVAWVYVGPINDNGWTEAHDRGRLAAVEKFGNKIETTYVENVAEGADAERIVRRLAQDGNELIFTTSFGFMNATAKVAAQFPDISFEHATGYKRSENMGTYIAKTYEGRYVAGMVAAKTTKTNKIGYIASFPIPEVIRDINTVELALNKYNPDAELQIVWVNTWYDPGKEADAANAMMDQGVDVILQHTDSPAAMQAAERRGARAVGQASDMSEFGPNAHLLSVMDDWAPHYLNSIEKKLNGTWESAAMVEGFAEGGLVIPGFNANLPQEVVDEAKSLIAQFEAGSLEPFTGPIYDNEGNLKIADGVRATWEDLEGMFFFVEGIDAKIPQ